MTTVAQEIKSFVFPGMVNDNGAPIHTVRVVYGNDMETEEARDRKFAVVINPVGKVVQIIERKNNFLNAINMACGLALLKNESNREATIEWAKRAGVNLERFQELMDKID